MRLRQWLPFLTLCGLAIVSMTLLYYAVTEPLSSEATSPSQPELLLEPGSIHTDDSKERKIHQWRKGAHTNTKKHAKFNKRYRYNRVRESIHNQRIGNVTGTHFRSISRFRRGNRPNIFKFARMKRTNPNKELYEYCDIADTPSLSQLLMQHNKYSPKLTANKIETLKQLRVTKPPPCDPNRTHPNHLNKLNINLDENNNLVPFINRCKVMALDSQPDLFEYYGYRDTPMAYLHIFKSGGSTVIETWDNLYRHLAEQNPALKVHWRFWHRSLPKEYRWMRDKEFFYENIFNKQFVFSFVRDPLTRFLSSFFEYVVRGNDDVQSQYMRDVNERLAATKEEKNTALHLLSELALIVEHRMKCEYKYSDGEDGMNAYLVNTLGIYWDDHLVPQMHFLLDDEWEPYSLNYVGYVAEIEQSLYNILVEYLDLDSKQLTLGNYKELIYYHARARRDKEYQTGEDTGKERKSQHFLHQQRIGVSDLVVEPNEISDELIQMICNLYWLDYICLPFKVPPQCNLTELYMQHYGNHVVYQPCYA